MTEKEMRKQVDSFIHEAFRSGIDTAEKAKDLLNRFAAFCKDNGVPPEIRKEFALSGAGEMLYMMQGI